MTNKNNIPRCPECNCSESTLVLDEDNFNILFEIIIDLNTRVETLEKMLRINILKRRKTK